MLSTVALLAIMVSAAGAQIRGFGLSPQGFPADYSKLAAFYAEVGSMRRSGIMWAGRWFDPSKAREIPAGAAAVAGGAAKYGYTPIIVFGWRAGTQSAIAPVADGLNTWGNAEASRLFQKTVAVFAARYNPPFIFLGNENDFYYEQRPEDYGNWIRVYNAAYDAVKAASPDTMVGPVFSFEHMAGAGKLNGWKAAHWGALTAHDMKRVDMVGVSVYPWLSVPSPGAVPAGYLDPLVERVGRLPIAITETGWPAEKSGLAGAAWETSAEAQVAYLPRLAAVVKGKDVRILNWLHLYQMSTTTDATPKLWKMFASVSMRDAAGAKRPVYDRWIDFLQ